MDTTGVCGQSKTKENYKACPSKLPSSPPPAATCGSTHSPIDPCVPTCSSPESTLSFKNTSGSPASKLPLIPTCGGSVNKLPLVSTSGSPVSKLPPVATCGNPPSSTPILSTRVPNTTRKSKTMERTKIVETLEKIRDPLADFQESRGLSKSENYGFTCLITSLCQHAYNAILTIFTMLYNLLPLLEGFLYLARFILDKAIEICQTEERNEKILKIVIFLAEMIVIFVTVMIICGFILFPVWYLFSTIFGKLFNMVLSSG